MKTKIKNLGMPVVVALIAIAGAFAGNVSTKKGDAPLVDRLGYTITCQQTSIMCTTDDGPTCTDVEGNTLYDFNGTSCPNPLNRKF